MNPTSSDSPPVAAHRSPKVLWLTIGALAVAVAALGGVLMGQHQRAPAGAGAPVAAVNQATVQAKPVPAPDDGVAPPAIVEAVQAPPPVPAGEPVRAPITAPAVQMPLQASAAVPSATAPAPAAAASPKPCATCGRVESVRTVQREQPTTGVGAVAGGVVGGVLGNQIGHGTGRTVATVAGAVGGGYLGNTIEKRTRTVTRYQVAVRMQNGTLRTVETGSAPPVGKAVTLKGGVLRPADGKA